MERFKGILTGFVVSVFVVMATPMTAVAATNEERDAAKAAREEARAEAAAEREARKNTDTDGDGVGDNADAFPTDPTETTDTDGDGVGDNADAFPTDPTRTSANSPPQIWGTPPTSVEQASAYAFMPNADDPDGDFITFSISGQPAWAHFDPVTGELFGTPSDDAHVGTTGEITISASDGVAETSLPTFTITTTALADQPTAPPAEPLILSTLPENYVWDTLAIGKHVYIDRTFTFSNVPARYEGWRNLKTANDDKYLSDPAAVSISVTEPVRVIVAYDRRISVLPTWLQDWNATSLTIDTTDTSFSVYTRDFSAGTVNLGGNEAGYSNYTVALAPLADIDASDNPPPPDDPTDINTPPTISGTPPASVDQDTPYLFVPESFDVDGDTLTFSIVNKPDWASFDTSTGRLSGTPSVDDAGFHRDIVISVDDASVEASLQSFDIEVVAIAATGSALLSWLAPTTNEDGTSLTDLAGYLVLYGPESGQWDYSIPLNNPGLTSHLIEGLTAGTWHFTVKAVDQAGNQSAEAAPASKLVQ